MGERQVRQEALFKKRPTQPSSLVVADEGAAEGGEGEVDVFAAFVAPRDFELAGGRAVTAAFAVNNLFDQYYYFRGVDTSPIGRVPGPGRSFLLNLTSTL